MTNGPELMISIVLGNRRFSSTLRGVEWNRAKLGFSRSPHGEDRLARTPSMNVGGKFARDCVGSPWYGTCSNDLSPSPRTAGLGRPAKVGY